MSAQDVPQWAWVLIALIGGGVVGGVGTGAATGAAAAVDKDAIVKQAVAEMDQRRAADLRWLETKFESLEKDNRVTQISMERSNAELKAEVKALRQELYQVRLAPASKK